MKPIYIQGIYASFRKFTNTVLLINALIHIETQIFLLKWNIIIEQFFLRQ